MSDKLKGNLLLLAANILFGLNMPISKYLLLGHLTPEALTIMRMSSACVLFWVASLFVPYEKVAPKDLALLFVCALTGIAINQAMFIQGLSSTSPVDSSIIVTSGPVIVMLLAAFLLKEPITGKKVGGVLLGVVGAVSLVLQSAMLDTATIEQGSLLGNLLIVGSAFMFGLYLVISKPLTARYSAVTMMKWMFLFATLCLAPFMLSSIASQPAFNNIVPDYTEMAAIAFVLIGATFIPYLMIPMGLRRIRPTTASMYNYVQPIIASCLAIAMGQDVFSIGKLTSALLIFVGVYLVTQSKGRKEIMKKTSKRKRL